MRVDVVGPESDAWASALRDVRHDVYHLPDYVSFAARRQDPGEPLAFIAEEHGSRLLVPFIARPIPGVDGHVRGGLRDATSPRGYPGPVVAGAAASAPDFAERAVACLRGVLRDAGIVVLFSRLHPLLEPPGHALENAGAVVDHGESISIDLGPPDDEWRRSIRSNHRRHIARARRAGYAARIDEEWDRLDDFVEVYAQSMDRLGAATFWRLSRDYFVDLRSALGSHLHLCVVEIDGDLAAAGLLTEVAGIVEYHLAGTSDAHLAASPSKLIVDYARAWARERGNRVLHLAGSLSTGDSLHHFKLGFSPRRHRVRSWRLVADDVAYRRLVAAWEESEGTQADAPDGYFPAYRKPSAHVAAGVRR